MKLYGKNPVLERLKTSPRSIHKIYLQEGHPEAGYISQKARQFAVPVVSVPATKLHKLSRSLNTQGIVADVDEFGYIPFVDLLSAEDSKKKVLIFIDELTDPQNLGAILRSTACLGEFALILPKHHTVEITEAVLRVACGGENYIPVAKVKNLSLALDQAKEAGYWIVGAVVKGGQDIGTAKLSFPLALVIGSEDRGIRDIVQKQLDLAVSIPMAHPRMAMNAAHAATVFAYEIVGRKREA